MKDPVLSLLTRGVRCHPQLQLAYRNSKWVLLQRDNCDGKTLHALSTCPQHTAQLQQMSLYVFRDGEKSQISKFQCQTMMSDFEHSIKIEPPSTRS